MSYSQLRKGRVSITGQIYVVTTVTIGRFPLFTDLHLGRAVVRALRARDACGDARTLAFVVMPDHLHWLVQMTGQITLSNAVKRVKGSSAREVNRLRGGADVVWQRAFHDHALRAEEDVRAAARYVVGNPLRAQLVRNIGDYPLWDAVWV